MSATNDGNKKLIHGYEILEAIDKEKDPVRKMNGLKYYGSRSPLNMLLSLNFDYRIELEIPSGMPPMDPKHMDSGVSHPDFAGLLASGISRLKHCVKQSPLKKFKKEQIFYNCLINCPLKDAEVLCSAKDHALEELYPSITADLVKQAFPNYVCQDVKLG
jgi:hypothetical protein